MLSMESLAGARGLGEESLQMWDLNKRLEAYLARVKFLEEENEVLRAEIQSAKGNPGGDPWRSKYEEELRALRTALDDAFREKWSAELARDNLYEEIQDVRSRCQKEQAAREEAKKLLSASKKELEEEHRAQIWLKERALHLEREVEALLEVHEEEKAGLEHELSSFSQSLESFRCVPVAFQPVEVEDYSKRLSEIWQGAVETYKTEVAQLESSLGQAKENLWKAVEGNQQSRLQLQHLEKELLGLKARKELLEESLSRQWQEQRGEAEKFQLALEALEQEKQALRVQIAQVLEDRQQLMHLKMSLSLEVATYRTLLEAESTRLQMPAGEYKVANGLRDAKVEMKLQPVTPESRRLLSWDLCTSPSVFPRAEAKMQLAKTPSDVPKAPSPKAKSSIAREFQKINSVLQAPALRAAGAAARSAPGMGTPGAVVPSARPCSREPPASPSPEPKERDKEPREEPQDPSEEPPASPSLEPKERDKEPCEEPQDPGKEPPASPSPEPKEGDKEPCEEPQDPNEEPPASPGAETEEGDKEPHEESQDPSEEPPASPSPEPKEGDKEPCEDPNEEPPVSPSLEPKEGDKEPCEEPQDPNEEPPASPAPEPKEGDKEPCEEPQDPSEEPPGKLPTPQLLYPDRLVTEALEDALKEVRDDAQPQEEPVCEAERAMEALGVASEAEVPSWSSHPMEEVDGAQDTNLEALLEERTGEDLQEEAGAEGTTWDGATSHLELGPSGEQDQGAPEPLAAAPREREIQGTRPWEEKASQEEEVLVFRSPEESGESEFACGDAENPPGEETRASSKADAEHWEGSEGLPSPGAAAKEDLEESEQGDEDGGAVSMEALDLLEHEERPWSPSKEEEESNFLEEAKEEQEEESLQEEIQATHACPVESHPVLAGEGHPGEDLVERETESLEQRDMALCEADPAADEEGMEEMDPEHEPSSSKEGIWAEEASPMPGEDTVGEETTDGLGERGEPQEEAVEEEELEAEGKTLAAEELKQEEGSVEESADVQENSPDHDVVEQEDLEALPSEEDLDGGNGESAQKPCSKEWQNLGNEDTEESPGIEDANIPPQEPAGADDMLTSTGEPGSEEMEGISLAETREEDDDDEDDAGISRQEPRPENKAEQETEMVPELMKEAQEDHPGPEGPPRDEELPMDPEIPWDARAEDAEEDLALEPDATEKVASQQEEDLDSDESQEEDAWRREEIGQEPGMCKSIRLEDTLPDNTPLHLYQGDTVATSAPRLNPLAAEDATEAAPGPEIVLEDEGDLEGSQMPTSALEDNHEEEAAGTEAAPAAEQGEEEEGYFMVSAPIQEVSSLEDGEIPEDFEEIKVGAVEGIGDEVQAPKEASSAPEEEEDFEALADEEDEGMKVPPEEGKMPKAGDFANEMEEAVEEPLGEDILVGSSDELEQDMQNPAVEPGMDEGQGTSEEDGGAGELECEAGKALESPSSDSSEQQETQEPILRQEDEVDATEFVPSQGLPPPMALQTAGEEIPESGSLSLAGKEWCSDANTSPEKEVDDGGHGEPDQDSGLEANCDGEGLDIPGKLPPGDVRKAADILEIVEQALEFNQELMSAARPAQAEQQVPGSIPAEKQELNGLPSEASLEDGEFPKELPNGIGEMQPTSCQEHMEPKATSAAAPAPPEEAQGEDAMDKPPAPSALLLSKFTGMESPGATRSNEELGQPQGQIRDEQELWSEEDE